VGPGAVLASRGTLCTPCTWRSTTRAPTRRFLCRLWERPTTPRCYFRRLSSAEMSASTHRGRLGVSNTRGGARWRESPSQIEARGHGLEQSPLPTGTHIRGARNGVSIVNRGSGSWGGSPIPPETRNLDTRGVSMPPPIGHRPGRTHPSLALPGAACSARHHGEEDQLGFPRRGLAHRHRPEED